MVTSPVHLGIDVGTQGVRAVVVAGDGIQIGAAARPLTDSLRDGPRHEQRPADWWTALTGAVREALMSAGHPRVSALCLDATSGTVLVEGPDGEPAGPALMYDDARAVAQADRAATTGAALWSALGYRLQPSWALPKVMWLLEQGAVPADRRVVHQADHLLRRLTGTVVPTDTSHALKTGADPRDVTWPADLLAELGVETTVLPELVLPGTPVGRVGPAAAEATGLGRDCEVRTGMTDGCAAQISARALRWGSWSSSLGTTLVVKGATRDLVRDPTGAVYCHRHPDGGWLPGGASSSGAGFFRDRLPGWDLEELTRAVAGRDLTRRTAYPLVGTGERFPFQTRQAESFLLPPGPVADDLELFGAAALGLAYVERLAYDVLAELGADVTGTVSLTGGGARNPWLNQLRADVLGRVAVVPSGAGPATGMAVLAASEPGDPDRGVAATAERMVAVKHELHPDAERAARLEPGYRDLVGELASRGWLDPALADRVLGPAEVAQ